MADLAALFRPKSLKELVGQSHLVSPKAPLFKLIESKKMPHAFFWGPPGTGKTTLAHIIARQLDIPFYPLNATTFKVEDLRKIVRENQGLLARPLIFIDEVHRLSKTQQEVLLPIMEAREALIMGASTENPFFSLTAAIRSRCLLFEFKPLTNEDLRGLLARAQKELNFTIDDDAADYLIFSSGGDARAMLTLLEFSLSVSKSVDLLTLKSLRPSALITGTSSDEAHYDLASALIKSIRGSDVDAALYYLARLIEGAEPPEFIARRLVILASEDIGNANPNALNLATSAMTAVSRIGYPEARIILSQCVIYLACSPKSNSAYTAIDAALKAVREGVLLPVPPHLKSPSPKGYLYPHDFGGWVKQEYLVKPLKFYESKPIAFEKTLSEWLEKIGSKKS